MKHSLGKYILFVGSLFVIIILLIILMTPSRTALVFYKEKTKQIEAFLPIEIGDTFQIIFTHSIHLSDVVEKYTVLETLEIKQDEIIYEEFGIGMPANAEDGETFVYEDGKYHIKDLNNVFPSMNIRNGKTVSEHRLQWQRGVGFNDQMVRFNDYFEPGSWFTVQVENLSLWQYWKGVRIHE